MLQQACAHLAPGGLLYVSFVSRLARLLVGAGASPGAAFWRPESVRTLLTRGTEFNFAQPEDGGLPNCYFCDPGELPALFADAGLPIRHVCATEGPFGGQVGRFHALEKPVREA